MKKKAMTAISIHIPDSLAKASQKLASKLNISRAAFIRIAIEHEIAALKKKQEIIAMAKCFEAMSHNKEYLKEAEEIMDGFHTPLPDEEDEWWKKK